MKGERKSSSLPLLFSSPQIGLMTSTPSHRETERERAVDDIKRGRGKRREERGNFPSLYFSPSVLCSAFTHYDCYSLLSIRPSQPFELEMARPADGRRCGSFQSLFLQTSLLRKEEGGGNFPGLFCGRDLLPFLNFLWRTGWWWMFGQQLSPWHKKGLLCLDFIKYLRSSRPHPYVRKMGMGCGKAGTAAGHIGRCPGD